MKSHRMQLPFAYEARLRRPRSRNYDTHTVRGVTTVELRSVTAEEAPIAFTLIRNSWRERKGMEDAPAISYRLFDDRLFLPVSDDPDFGAADFAAAVKANNLWTQILKPAPFHGAHYPVMPALLPTHSQWPMGRPTLEEDMASHGLGPRHLISTTLNEREGEAQVILMRDLAIIDGRMWSAAPAKEPQYQVVSNGAPDRKFVSLELVLDPGPLFYTSGFRIDGRQKAEDFAASERDRLGHSDLVMTPDAVEVFLPEALRRDDVIMTAKTALGGLPYSQNDRDYEPWPGEAREIMVKLHLMRRVAELTIDQAVDTLTSVTRFAEIFADRHPNEQSEIVGMIRNTATARNRWLNFELPARPDLLESQLGTESDFSAFSGI